MLLGVGRGVGDHPAMLTAQVGTSRLRGAGTWPGGFRLQLAVQFQLPRAGESSLKLPALTRFLGQMAAAAVPGV